jgi:hypothetical protein
MPTQEAHLQAPRLLTASFKQPGRQVPSDQQVADWEAVGRCAQSIDDCSGFPLQQVRSIFEVLK